MPKTREFKLRGFQYPVFLHRLDDWSKMAIIQWTDEYTQEPCSAEIPAELLLRLSIEDTKRFVLNAVAHTIERLGERHDEEETSDEG